MNIIKVCPNCHQKKLEEYDTCVHCYYQYESGEIVHQPTKEIQEEVPPIIREIRRLGAIYCFVKLFFAIVIAAIYFEAHSKELSIPLLCIILLSTLIYRFHAAISSYWKSFYKKYFSTEPRGYEEKKN